MGRQQQFSGSGRPGCEIIPTPARTRLTRTPAAKALGKCASSAQYQALSPSPFLHGAPEIHRPTQPEESIRADVPRNDATRRRR